MAQGHTAHCFLTSKMCVDAGFLDVVPVKFRRFKAYRIRLNLIPSILPYSNSLAMRGEKRLGTFVIKTGHGQHTLGMIGHHHRTAVLVAL